MNRVLAMVLVAVLGMIFFRELLKVPRDQGIE
jgi:hypothetical protein